MTALTHNRSLSTTKDTTLNATTCTIRTPATSGPAGRTPARAVGGWKGGGDMEANNVVAVMEEKNGSK